MGHFYRIYFRSGVYKHDLETLQEVNAGLVAELRKASIAANRFPMPAQLRDEDDVVVGSVENSSIPQNSPQDDEGDEEGGDDDPGQNVGDLQEGKMGNEIEGLQRMLQSLESVNRELMEKMQFSPKKLNSSLYST